MSTCQVSIFYFRKLSRTIERNLNLASASALYMAIDKPVTEHVCPPPVLTVLIS